MVGREDEVHFMLPAGWWTTAGLVLSLVGVVLLFRYGMPYRVRTRGQPIRVAISSDCASEFKRFDRRGSRTHHERPYLLERQNFRFAAAAVMPFLGQQPAGCVPRYP